MADNHRELRVDDDPTTHPHDEARDQESSALPVARLLANPRRVRRA